MKVNFKEPSGETSTYEVRWKRNKLNRKVYHCEIRKNGELIGEGTSIASEKDEFRKDVGRKISMQRALITVRKPVRLLLWEAYRVMTKKPRWNKDDRKTK